MVGDAFKALGDPTRRRILELLSEGEMSAGVALQKNKKQIENRTEK